MTIEQVSAPAAYHGEGAYWDAAAGCLRSVDMLAGDILTLRAGEIERTHVADVAAVIRGRQDGGYVIATERGFALTDEALTITREIPVFDDTTIRMNEGGCDPQGRLYVGSMAYDTRDAAGCLYRLDPDLSVHVVLEGVTIPNGLLWAPDGTTVYHADTGLARVTAYTFDADAGMLSDPRTLIEFSGPAVPDGMALDEEGYLWIALWEGAGVSRYAPDGRLDRTVALPVSNVTSCAFGGPDGDELFITTSRQGIPDGEQPEAGALFRLDAGLRGAPVALFAG